MIEITKELKKSILQLQFNYIIGRKKKGISSAIIVKELHNITHRALKKAEKWDK